MLRRPEAFMKVAHFWGANVGLCFWWPFGLPISYHLVSSRIIVPYMDDVWACNLLPQVDFLVTISLRIAIFRKTTNPGSSILTNANNFWPWKPSPQWERNPLFVKGHKKQQHRVATNIHSLFQLKWLIIFSVVWWHPSSFVSHHGNYQCCVDPKMSAGAIPAPARPWFVSAEKMTEATSTLYPPQISTQFIPPGKLEGWRELQLLQHTIVCCLDFGM